MKRMSKLTLLSIACIFVGAYIAGGFHLLGIVMIIAGFWSLTFRSIMIDIQNDRL